MARKAKHHVIRREPSGRRSRAIEDEPDPVPPTSAKRLRDAAVRGMAEPEWGTELGRLWLASKVSASQYNAGRKWLEVRQAYFVAIGAPLPHEPPGPIASLGTPSGRGEHEDPPIGSKEGRRLKERRDRAVAEYEKAAVTLGNGVDLLAAFRLTVERDETPVGAVGLSNLQWCLGRLARLWGMAR